MYDKAEVLHIKDALLAAIPSEAKLSSILIALSELLKEITLQWVG